MITYSHNALVILRGWDAATARYYHDNNQRRSLTMRQARHYFRGQCTAFARFPEADGVDRSIGSTLRFLERQGALREVGRSKRGGPVFEKISDLHEVLK